MNDQSKTKKLLHRRNGHDNKCKRTEISDNENSGEFKIKQLLVLKWMFYSTTKTVICDFAVTITKTTNLGLPADKHWLKYSVQCNLKNCTHSNGW